MSAATTPTLLLRLARNNHWANERLYQACAALDDAELRAPRTGFFPSILLTLNHILVVDWAYLRLLLGEPDGARRFDGPYPFDRFDALRAAQAAADRDLIAHCAALTPAMLDDPMPFPRPQPDSTRRRETILLHLMHHQTHHRGQVHAMLSGTRIAPPQIDEYFMDFDPAA